MNTTKPKTAGDDNQSKEKRKNIKNKQKQQVQKMHRVIHTPTPNATITPGTNTSTAIAILLKGPTSLTSMNTNTDCGNNLRRSARLQNNGTVKKDADADADADAEIKLQLSSIPPSSEKNDTATNNHRDDNGISEWFITPTNVSIQNGTGATATGVGARTAIATEGYEIIQTRAVNSRNNRCTNNNNNNNNKDSNEDQEENMEEVQAMNDGKSNNHRYSIPASSCFSFSNLSSVTQSTALRGEDQEGEESQDYRQGQEQGVEIGMRGRNVGSWSSFIITGGLQENKMLCEKPTPINLEKLNTKKRPWKSSFPQLVSKAAKKSNKKNKFVINKTPPPHPTHPISSYRIIPRNRSATAYSITCHNKKEKRPLKSYHHRYRLRSLSTSDINQYKFDRTNIASDNYSDKECITNTKKDSISSISCDGNIDQEIKAEKNYDKTKFVNLDTLSKLYLCNNTNNSISNSSNASKSLYHCTVSHVFLSDYGSMYYQSLLNREEQELLLSKKRLEAYCVKVDYGQLEGTKASHHYSGTGKKAAATTKTAQTRVRTRRFCKIEEEKCTTPKTHDNNTTNTIVTASPPTQGNDRSSGTIGDVPIVSPMYIQVGKQNQITAEMRCTLVDWMIDVTREFKLTHETLHYCICLIDRSLEDIVVSKATFHCLGCACLLIASKLVETKHPRAADIAFFTNNACTVTDICEMEMEITKVLAFHLQLVTAFHFIGRFVNASNIRKYRYISVDDDENDDTIIIPSLPMQLDSSSLMKMSQKYSFDVNLKLEVMALYFLDMSLLIPELVDMKKSLVAAAALYITRAITGIRDNDGNIWNDAMVHYTKYTVEDLAEAVSLLHHYQHSNITEENNSKRRAIFKKYSSKDYLQVAKRATILFEDLNLQMKKVKKQ